jgi:hypothetical protein
LIPERSDQLGKLHAEHVVRPETTPKMNGHRPRVAGVVVDVEAAIEALVSDPRRRDNLDYISDSEADGALFHHLAFFCQGDVAMMEEAALRSGRRRPKWHGKRSGTTWLRWELGKAADRVTEAWEPASNGNQSSAIRANGSTSFVNFVSFVPDPLPWPVLADEALHGLPGEIVRAIEPHTEADPAAVLVNLLAAYGSAIGRGAYFRVGADTHYLRINVGLVGETSKGRKGMSWGHVRDLMRATDGEWAENRVLHGLSSGEGLIYAVRDRVEDENKKGEKVVLDSGVEDKRLLVLEAELAGVLKVMNREGNTLSPIIRQAWDDGSLQTLTKNNPMKATGAHVSIIGHITKAELLRHLTETEAANGFANRFVGLLVKRSKELPFGGEWYKVDTAPLVRRLEDALEHGSAPVEVTWGEGAREAWREVYGPLSEGKPGLFGAVVGRAEAQVMRLAALYAVMDESYEIEHEHLLAALALWEYAEASARYVFGDATGDPVADQIAEALKAAGDGGMTRTEISGLFGRNKGADHIGRALGLLLSVGRVRRETEETKGRPSERWFTK